MNGATQQQAISRPSADGKGSLEIVDDRLSKWYEEKSAEDIKNWTRPAVDANDRITESFRGVKLTSKETEVLENVSTLDEFLALTKDLESQHRKKKGSQTRDMVQVNIESFQGLAHTFKPVVDTVVGAVPFGAGNLAWGLCSIVITVIANKHKSEKLINGFVIRITKSLPRLDAYRELYPTDRMIQQLAELYAKVVAFLREAFMYYRQLDWRGSISRVFSSASGGLYDELKKLVSDIDTKSQEIREEGLIGLSAELRMTRLAVGGLKKDTSNIKKKAGNISEELSDVKRGVEESLVQVSDLKTKVNDTERQECLKDVSKIKHLLVPSSYDASEISSVAYRQLRSLPRDMAQVQSCKNLLQETEFIEWCKPTPTTPAKKIPQRKDLLWVTSSQQQDLTVSHCAFDFISSLNESKDPAIILQSVHQTEIPYSSFQGGKRTAITIIKEAIYQLLLRKPALVRTDKSLKALRQSLDEGSDRSWDLSLQRTGSLLQTLIQSVVSTSSSESKESQPLLIFWIIDRIDDCKFKGFPGASKLSAFGDVLESLARGCKGNLRVLITSTYEPQRLDKSWEDDEDGDSKRVDNWVEIKYKSK